MSAKFTFLAWLTKVKDSSTKLALLQLANNADDSGFSYYSISKMALSCNMSERSFMRKIKTLEECGVLTVERRANRPSLYTLIGDEMGVTICQPEVTDCHPEVTGCHLVGDRLSPDLNNTLNTDLKIHCSISSNDVKSVRVKIKGFDSERLEIAFDNFWENMGLRKGSKPTAKIAFSKAFKRSEYDCVDMFSKMLVDDSTARKESNQFAFDRTLPASYLNREIYNNDFDVKPSNSNAIDHVSNGDVMKEINKKSKFF